ncbi:tyrosine 2,3-aminomutase [Candidatus Tisiphia endosymbiont of Xenochironomus xenolabis]|uniref:tyrosine 2,3-aminomutase n=1 Tax=unclassified Candidatus Tisiphia TaxID=2996318 RepID=UPI0035C912C2
MKNIILDGESLSIRDVCQIVKRRAIPYIDESVYLKIEKSRSILEDAVHKEPIYGVTTGYGEMVYQLISTNLEKELQTNLIRSHAACVGNLLSKEQCKAILTVRINAFCKGNSGVRRKLVEQLLLYLRHDIIPAIPEIGSLGASGDLGQLAHLALTCIGEGYVFDEDGNKTDTINLLKKYNIAPLELKYKEGLALINGTSAMTGIACLNLENSIEQVKQAEIITALILEVLNSSSGAFQKEGHLARPHKGQLDCAENLLKLLEGSKLISSHSNLKNELISQKQDGSTTETKTYIQKAYTLRCVPQILGAVRDTVEHARNVVTIEVNSSNDNPLFFEGKEIFHGGNFHGQPVSFVMDYCSIALTQLGVVSERRINRLLNKHLSNGLPEFLAKSDPGLNCAFEGAQYPATALVAENRCICSPASIQSIPSNGDNQDVVSMGLIASRNNRKILDNNYYILAIEAICGVQAVDIMDGCSSLSEAGKITYNFIREYVETLNGDRYMSNDIENIFSRLKDGELLNRIEKANIKLR